jgi:hypothetical protein
LKIGAPADASGFQPTKTAFAAMPPAKTMEQLAKNGKGGGGSGGPQGPQTVGTPGQPVPAPAAQYRTLSGGKVFQAAIPSNWTSLPSKSSIKAVPENGYGELNGEVVFSHGVEFGIVKAESRNLQEATNAWLQSGFRSVRASPHRSSIPHHSADRNASVFTRRSWPMGACSTT